MACGAGAASVSLPTAQGEPLVLWEPWRGAGQDPSQSPSNASKPHSVPAVQGVSEGFGKCRDRASSTPLSPRLSQPQLAGSLGCSVADLGAAKGREGRGLCLPPVGFGWSSDQAEASPRVLEVGIPRRQRTLQPPGTGRRKMRGRGMWSVLLLPRALLCCVSILNMLQTSWWAWGSAACCR